MKKRLWKTAISLFAAVAMLLPMASPMVTFAEGLEDASLPNGALYNGIVIPDDWTFSFQDAEGDRITPPYLLTETEGGYAPDVINIDTGRQLFVDDFLIGSMTGTLDIDYKKAETLDDPLFCEAKYNGNTTAVLTSGGVWYDEGIYKMWYQTGFAGKIAYAESADGINWEFPTIENNNNFVLDDPYGDDDTLKETLSIDFIAKDDGGATPKGPRLDGDQYVSQIAGSSVWIDYKTENPEERYKMMLRQMDKAVSSDGGAWLLVSADGKTWKLAEDVIDGFDAARDAIIEPNGALASDKADTNVMGDRTTFHYNELLNKWVFSIRYSDIASTNWQGKAVRARLYNEGSTWLDAATWNNFTRSTLADLATTATKANIADTLVKWYMTDTSDPKDTSITNGVDPQLYNMDSIAYESITLGLFQILYGPEVDDLKDWPKITDIQAAYSRDGYYYYRPELELEDSLISASRTEGDWDYGYLSTTSGGVIVLDDEIRIYYSGMSGQGTNVKDELAQEAHQGGSISYATLRRDGFASVKGTGSLTTNDLTVTKDAKYLFVNADIAAGGSLKAEILDTNGNVVSGYSAADCVAFTGDSCKQMITWNNAGDLSFLVGKGFKIRFVIDNGELYSFWLSTDTNGSSDGAMAAGYAGSSEAEEVTFPDAVPAGRTELVGQSALRSICFTKASDNGDSTLNLEELEAQLAEATTDEERAEIEEKIKKTVEKKKEYREALIESYKNKVISTGADFTVIGATNGTSFASATDGKWTVSDNVASIGVNSATKLNVNGQEGTDSSYKYNSLMTVDLGKLMCIDGFSLVTRNANVMPQSADIYVSNDGKNWTLVDYYDRLAGRAFLENTVNNANRRDLNAIDISATASDADESNLDKVYGVTWADASGAAAANFTNGTIGRQTYIFNLTEVHEARYLRIAATTTTGVNNTPWDENVGDFTPAERATLAYTAGKGYTEGAATFQLDEVMVFGSDDATPMIQVEGYQKTAKVDEDADSFDVRFVTSVSEAAMDAKQINFRLSASYIDSQNSTKVVISERTYSTNSVFSSLNAENGIINPAAGYKFAVLKITNIPADVNVTFTLIAEIEYDDGRSKVISVAQSVGFKGKNAPGLVLSPEVDNTTWGDFITQ